MKKLLSIAASACLLAIPLKGQEALWSSASALPSPQVADDGSVVFRLYAPDATDVILTGDMLPQKRIETSDGKTFYVPGAEKMRKDANGVWNYSVSNLPPEIYSYAMIVDGVRANDPSNVFRLRDVNSVSDIFIVPGERTDLYSVKADTPHGTVSKVWYPSPTAGKDRRLTVYTPAGYETDTERRYPVLYLLHGMGGDENAWTELGRASQILDNMIARGLAEPMIVVMPNGNISQQAAPGETAEGLRQPTTNLPHTTDGVFEQSFPEITHFVDKAFRTIADRDHRAIAGLSMGGLHAMTISHEQPDDFGYIGLFSAAVRPIRETEAAIYGDLDAKLRRHAATSPRLYWIAIGTDDFLYDFNSDFRRRLGEAGMKFEYIESEGGHTWRNWRDYLTRFLPQLFRYPKFS